MRNESSKETNESVSLEDLMSHGLRAVLSHQTGVRIPVALPFPMPSY